MCPDSGNGTVEFVILLDGVEAARSGILTATSPAYVFDVDVSGASVITFRLTNGGDSAAYDGADWCDAYFTVIA
jgi:beta-galactosidase